MNTEHTKYSLRSPVGGEKRSSSGEMGEICLISEDQVDIKLEIDIEPSEPPRKRHRYVIVLKIITYHLSYL